jgi:hypothetical protein
VPQIRACAGRSHAAALLMCFVSVPAALAATHNVPAGGDLQAALNAAQPGDVIVLAPGATYTGNFKLPVKHSDGYVVVRSGAAARDLPPAGVRTNPGYAPALPKIQSPNTAPALATDPGAHHWRIENLEFLATAKGVGDIIVLGAGGSQTQLSQMPHDLIFDRVYIHGDAVFGQKRGIALNSGVTQILNSYIADIKSVGQDSQAIAGWNGSGPYLIENNYLEAAGENVLFGGADPSVWNLVPSDITVRRNLMSKPEQWRSEKWQVKNAFELKNARRVLVEGNTFEHVWPAAQNGIAILFTPRNQSGGAPWSVVEDVTFQYNVVRDVSAVFNLTGFDDLQTSAQTRRIRIAHNLIYGVDKAVWGGSGNFMQIGHSPADVIVEHNTVLHTGNVVMAHGRSNGGPAAIEGFVFRDNFMKHNKYGIIGEGLAPGQATLAGYFPGVVFERNVLAGGKASSYPAGNYFPSVEEFEAAFVNAAGENFALAPGSPFRNGGSNGSVMGADLGRLNAFAGGATTPTPAPVASAPAPGRMFRAIVIR